MSFSAWGKLILSFWYLVLGLHMGFWFLVLGARVGSWFLASMRVFGSWFLGPVWVLGSWSPCGFSPPMRFFLVLGSSLWVLGSWPVCGPSVRVRIRGSWSVCVGCSGRVGARQDVYRPSSSEGRCACSRGYRADFPKDGHGQVKAM